MAETVKSLALQVAEGKLSGEVAGKRMKNLVTRREPIVTIVQKRESHNSAAYEEDQNSWVHVYAMVLDGRMSEESYAAVKRGMDG